jgi:acetyltransferase EpsM
MNLKDLIIWGASGHALVVSEIIRLAGEYEIVAFVDNVNEGLPGTFQGLPLLQSIDQLKAFYQQGASCIVAIGHCNARLKLAELVKAHGFELGRAIHPKALLAEDVLIGRGSVIVGGAVINPGSRIGENVIVNTSASVDHECIIEDGAHIGPGAQLGGRVHVGRAAWVGIGATIKDRVRVGANSIVGAGAVVLTDVPDNSVVVGVPAKVKRNVEPDEN